MSTKQLFKKLGADYNFFEKERRAIISISSEILNKSKQAIFSLHRDDQKKAKELLAEAEQNIKKAEEKFKQDKRLKFEGSYKAAVEEYAEAKLFYKFLTEGHISEIKEAKLEAEDYLGALSDYTGELLRKAVLLATEKKFDKVKEIKNEMDEVMANLIELNLTGYLRTKYDSAKRNLRRIEEIMYDLSIRS